MLTSQAVAKFCQMGVPNGGTVGIRLNTDIAGRADKNVEVAVWADENSTRFVIAICRQIGHDDLLVPTCS